MKLSKEQLKQIIKEELEAIIAEERMISMDEYSKMSPEEQEKIDPADVVGYVGPDGEDAYGNKPPPPSGTFSEE